jgi:hypothetical protein
MAMVHQVEREYDSSQKPKFITDPHNSLIRCMAVEEFDSLSDEQAQELHAKKHILVTGMAEEKFGFDKIGMRTLAPLQRTISIQGM